MTLSTRLFYLISSYYFVMCTIPFRTHLYTSLPISFHPIPSSLSKLTTGQDTNRVKLGSAGVCAALVGCLNAQSENETVVKFGCRAVFEICLDEANRVAMHAAGACECLTLLLKIHLPNVPVAQQCCRAIAGCYHNITHSCRSLIVYTPSSTTLP